MTTTPGPTGEAIRAALDRMDARADALIKRRTFTWGKFAAAVIVATLRMAPR